MKLEPFYSCWQGPSQRSNVTSASIRNPQSSPDIYEYDVSGVFFSEVATLVDSIFMGLVLNKSVTVSVNVTTFPVFYQLPSVQANQVRERERERDLATDV